MKPPTSGIQAFAERLVDYDTAGSTVAQSKGKAFTVCDKLKYPLATLMGGSGYQALLNRALAMAKKDVTWLSSIEVNSDGGLVGLEENFAKVNLNEWHEAKVALVARMIELLLALIGEDLTLNLVHDVWPRMPHRDLNLDIGD